MPLDFTRALNQLAPSNLPDEVQAELQSGLRKLAEIHMARERPEHTLQSTALLNEAYLRIWSSAEGKRHYPSRGHFYALASKAMRGILVDHARKKKSKKRGGDWSRITLVVGRPTDGGGYEPADPTPAPCEKSADLIDLSEALRELESVSPNLAHVIELRFFGGLSNEALAETIDASERTVERRLRAGTAWLLDRLDDGSLS